MAKRIIYIEIADKKYPLSFSLGVAKAMTAKVGNINNFDKLFMDEDGNMTAQHMDNIVWMLETMMKSGVAYMNTFGSMEPKEEGVALDKDGKYIALTSEEIELVLDMDSMTDIVSILAEAMNASRETDIDVEVEEKDSKNEGSPHTD